MRWASRLSLVLLQVFLLFAAQHVECFEPTVQPILSNTYDKLFASFPNNTWVIVEFFQPWCPHCRNFAPTYAQVAQYWHAKNATTEEESVIVANVDCTDQSSLCSKFNIHSYPTMIFGHRTAWLARNPSDPGLTIVQASPRSRENVIQWIRNHLPKHQAPTNSVVKADDDENAVKIQDTRPLHPSRGQSWDVEKAMAMSFEMIMDGRKHTPAARLALAFFLQTLVSRHPDPVCRTSYRTLAGMLEDVWPANTQEMDLSSIKRIWKHCGREWSAYDADWVNCHSSVPGARGYTCGLWETFHTLTVSTDFSDQDGKLGKGQAFLDSGMVLNAQRVTKPKIMIASGLTPDGQSGLDVLLAIRSFVEHFFGCEDCREHFLSISEPLVNDGSGGVMNEFDAILWLWRVHNVVNSRTVSEDPQFPKVQWPPESQCVECWWATSSDLRDIAVLRYMYSFYRAPYSGWNPKDVDSLIDKFLISRGSAIKGPLLASKGMVDPLEGYVGSFDLFNAQDGTIATPIGFLLLCIFIVSIILLANLWRNRFKSDMLAKRFRKNSGHRSYMV